MSAKCLQDCVGEKLKEKKFIRKKEWEDNSPAEKSAPAGRLGMTDSLCKLLAF